MCGIAGLLAAGGHPVDDDRLRGMIGPIIHRGPDQTGVVTKGSIGLAAARLSIVDHTEAGAQPFHDEHAALTLNGEIYNHRELRARLESAGVAFRGHSDTEVLFHALCRWGVEATLPQLRGMFAFAFADFDRQTVSLARDRLGIKPLLWTDGDSGLAWASEAKALAGVRPLTPDPIQALFAVAGRIDRSPSLTAFRGIHQLPPGHCLHAARDATPQVTSWWSVVDEVDAALYAELDGLGTPELLDRFDQLMGAAVDRMTSDETAMATFISGGVDSSLIASLAASDDCPPALFTADVGGVHSEADAARQTAVFLGQPLVVCPYPRESLVADWARATWHLEAPLITHVNALPFGRVAQAAHEAGIKSVLTGEGADELFFGYPESAATRYRRVLDAPTAAHRWTAERIPRPYRSALAPRGASQADFLAELVGHFDRADLESAGSRAFDFLAPTAAARHGSVVTWLGEHLLTLMHRNDAMGMATSVEARFPYLDEDVLRFGVNLPIRAKVATSRRVESHKHPFVRNKAIIRGLAARRLPAAIAGRPKAGFPMYGHQHVRFERSFWNDGYVTDLLGLPARAVAHLDTDVDPYLAAKLASVEVFGRLFDRGDTVDQVTDHLQETARVLP